MKILDRTLTDDELAKFIDNPIDTERAQRMGYMLDVGIGVALFLAVPWFATTTGYVIMWAFYLLYAFHLIVMSAGLRALISYHKDLRKMSPLTMAALISFGNSALDWPFGPRARLLAIKNSGFFAAALWCIHYDYILLGAMVLVAYVLNEIGKYYQGKVTLAVLDGLSFREDE